MRFGFHISIAGGLSRVPERAKGRHCQAIQLFSRNPRGWRYGPLDEREAESLRAGILKSEINPVCLHLPYLVNLAGPDRVLYGKSVESVAEELRRAPILGARYVIVHVGKALGLDENESLKRVIAGVDSALSEVDNEAILLLETTAGMGTEVGYRFGQIARILDESKHGSRLGVCLDTAHTFEAGYDWSTAKGFDKAAREFKREIGFPALRVIHLNDSKTPLGSRVDRHWHIGKGSIGEDGMRRLINHPPFSKLPGIMETPRKSDKDDLANLRVARRLSK